MRNYAILIIACFAISCGSSAPGSSRLSYYEVGFKGTPTDWRDTSFVVATSSASLIAKIDSQLKLPFDQRQLVTGALVAGDGGYNKNATHAFKWHFVETDWDLTDMAIELCDGRPYSDVDKDTSYWINTVKRFCPWNSYIKKKL